MHIVIVNNSLIPSQYYGGTERVIWGLAKELYKAGNKVSFLVKQGSKCPFADIIPIDNSKDVEDQIPDSSDLVHFNFTPQKIEKIRKPYIVTIHGNGKPHEVFDLNTVFVSEDHARRHGSDSFVYNGLDWENYSKPDLQKFRNTFHFLGNASWKVKNVKGAINLITKTRSEKLSVLGGNRFNFRMGIRLTFSPRIRFFGVVNDVVKSDILNQSKGLIFPVRWYEPFGLAIIESLYFGCPVFGTPYGSLNELVLPEFGFLSEKMSNLHIAIENAGLYNKKLCHEYAADSFNSKRMALRYIEKYDLVLNGKKLNTKHPVLLNVNTPKLLEWIE